LSGAIIAKSRVHGHARPPGDACRPTPRTCGSTSRGPTGLSDEYFIQTSEIADKFPLYDGGVNGRVLDRREGRHDEVLLDSE
jgi:hypothetical protein